MRRAVALWAFILAAILGTAHVAAAQGFTPSSTTLAVQVRADSLRVVGRAFPRADAAGAVDSVRWAWTVNGVPLTRTTRRTVDTLTVLRAPCPTATTLALTATAYRRASFTSASTSRTAGCRDALTLDSVVIDTGTVWRTARRVDSLPPAGGYWYDVLRADSTHAMVDVFRDPKTQAITGAQVRAVTTCEGMWWPLGDTTSVRTAQARAAQWPTDTLTARATRTWLAVDYSMCDYCRVWQQRCG